MKTAVEYLSYMYALQGAIYQVDINKAIEMEKEQIGNAYYYDPNCGEIKDDGEQYYNETFKQQEQCKCGQPKVGGYSCQRTDCNQNL